MKLSIHFYKGNIITHKDFTEVDGRGEIAHFIAEIESIKQDLLDLFENWEREEDGEA